MTWRASVEVKREWFPGPHGIEFGGGIWLYLPDRMFRVYAVVGQAPGSHMGLWKTSLPADGLAGWNYRVGSIRRCLTVLAHTRSLTA
jgi:hypothetical protein